MTETPEARLEALGLTLPEPPTPVASYVPSVRAGELLWLSGQIPTRDGKLPRTGLVGRDISVEDATEEARYAALNALAQIKAGAGDLSRVKRIVKVQVFVASSEGFHSQPTVANGASELFVEIFGDAGRHARSAVGVAELPLGAPVELDVVVQLGDVPSIFPA
ncbi:MAG: RidA family protein [Actinomycetota bacterium]|nr:RidA family protein [Actinomycetota bacterium]